MNASAYTYLFGPFAIADDNLRRLAAVSAAASSAPPIGRMMPARDQAIVLFDEVIASIPAPKDDDGPIRNEARARLLVGAGRALGDAILPCLQPGDLTAPRLAFAEACTGLADGGGALAGFHEVARLSPDLTARVASELKRAVSRGGLREVEGASRSIADWAELMGEGRHPPLPEALKDAVIAALEVGVRQGLHPRLWCARRLLKAGALSASQATALHSLLSGLWAGLAYDATPREGSEAVGITVARAECVRLARVLTQAGYFDEQSIANASFDPLPEVRYADEVTG